MSKNKENDRGRSRFVVEKITAPELFGGLACIAAWTVAFLSKGDHPTFLSYIGAVVAATSLFAFLFLGGQTAVSMMLEAKGFGGKLSTIGTFVAVNAVLIWYIFFR